VKGWVANGYEFGLERHNDDYIYCIGRGLNIPGAHTRGMNDKAIGICLVGNYDIIEPDPAQYWMLAVLCRNLIRDFSIPMENLKLHREYNKNKSCPGKLFNLEEVKKYINPKKFC
jgi:N-acetyl-anhydromuramyl-L-alanine amidase AmpD